MGITISLALDSSLPSAYGCVSSRYHVISLLPLLCSIRLLVDVFHGRKIFSPYFAYIMSEMADADYEEPLDSDKTPVTIVTGFLGSGKTTLGKLEV